MLSRAPSCPVNCSRATRTSTHLWGFQSHHHCRAPVFTHTDCSTGPGGEALSQAGPWAPNWGPACAQFPAPQGYPGPSPFATSQGTPAQCSQLPHFTLTTRDTIGPQQGPGRKPVSAAQNSLWGHSHPLFWVGKRRPGESLCLPQRHRVSQWHSWRTPCPPAGWPLGHREMLLHHHSRHRWVLCMNPAESFM